MTKLEGTRLELFLERSPDACMLLENGRLIDLNRAALKMLELDSREQALGLSPSDFTTVFCLDGTLSNLAGVKPLQSAVEKGFTRFECTLKPRNGVEIPVEVTLTLLEDGDTPLIHAALKDLSAQKKTEAEVSRMAGKYKELFENLQDIYFETSLEGTILEISPSVELYSHYTREELIGKDASLLYRDPGRRQHFVKLLTENGRFSDLEVDYMDSNGGTMHLSMTAHLKRDENGKPSGIIGILRDMTKRREMEKKLQDQIHLLENLERLNAVLRRSAALEELLRDALDVVLDIFRCDRVWLLHPCDPAAKSWSVPVERNRPDFPGAHANKAVFPMEEGMRRLMADVLAAEEPNVYIDRGEHHASHIKPYSIKSRLAVAVRPRLGPPWMLGIHQCDYPREWTSLEKTLFREMGWRIADALSAVLLIEDIKKSERRFREITFSMADWVWEVDRKGRITYSSDKIKDILGYAPEEIIGKHPVDFMPGDEARRVGRILMEIQSKAGVISDLVNWNVHKDGRDVCLLTNGFPIFDEEGKVSGFRGVDKDITKLILAEKAIRENERKYRELFERASMGILIVGANSEVMDANPCALTMLGYELGEIRGLTGNRIIHPDDLAQKQVARPEELSLDRVLRLERRYRKKSGEYMPVEVGVCRYQEDFTMVMFQDVSERKRMEKALLHSQKMEAVGTLAAGVAHDFNNLLQAIIGYAELLSDKNASETVLSSGLVRIRESAERGSALVKNLLAFSRSEAARFAHFDINAEISRAAGILERTIPKMIRLNLKLGKNLPPLLGSSHQMEQVFLNLATNARDAMPEGGELCFETSLQESGTGPSIIIRVSDTGSGMDAETISHIFDPFFTTKPQGRGTGLGLSSVYGIIKSHGGEITVKSERGAGSVFELTFPAASPKGMETAPEDQDNPEESRQASGTILVVDDEPYVLDISKALLEKAGYTVITVAGGVTAIDLFERIGKTIDLVILDLSMPDVGGMEVLKAIREAGPETKVVISTGYASEKNENSLIEAGAAGILAKPFNKKELLETVERFMAKGQGEDRRP